AGRAGAGERRVGGGLGGGSSLRAGYFRAPWKRATFRTLASLELPQPAAPPVRPVLLHQPALEGLQLLPARVALCQARQFALHPEELGAPGPPVLVEEVGVTEPQALVVRGGVVT